MSSIDKIYFNKKQSKEYLSWCDSILPKALLSSISRDQLRPSWWENDIYSAWDMYHTNYNSITDEFVFDNCPIEHVKERIMDQYGSIENLREAAAEEKLEENCCD